MFLLCLLAAAILFNRCAHPVSPEGGPKDVTPPKVLGCDPPNFSTNFQSSSIRIAFREFIALKNPLSEIFISPPLAKAPDPRLRGKDLLVKLQDTLRGNTTYSISFGQAIADLTEGNQLRDFTYVFSTGDYIDSLSLKGRVISAFNHQPLKNVFVTLYLNNNDTLPFDSLPLKTAPYYLTKTDERGDFTLSNLQDAPFKLMAIDDQNGDLIFNQPSEKIAYSDSLVKPYYIEIPKPTTADSSKKDTIPVKQVQKIKLTPAQVRITDSIRQADSVKTLNAKYPSFELMLFEETDSIQRIAKSAVPRDGMIVLTFKYPIKNAEFTALNVTDSLPAAYLRENSPRQDSVTLWLSGSHADTLRLKVSDKGRILDTLNIDLQKKVKKKKDDNPEPPERLAFTTNGGGGSGFNQYRSEFTITFSYPLEKWDFGRILLVDGKDTLHPQCKFADSIKRRVVVGHKWKEEKPYKLLIPDSVFFGINNLTHDSLRIEIKTKAPKEFGNLVLTFNPKKAGQYIVQILNEKETSVIEEQIATDSTKLNFNNMLPGKFKIKAILDKNLNRHWDTGNYRKNLQPEKVFYLSKTLEIRANWDIEETWDL
jgi:hypothetical protein